MWTSVNEEKGEERAEDDGMDMRYERERSEPQSGVNEYMCEEEENMEEKYMCEEDENIEEKMIRIDWEEMLRRIGDISMSVEEILGDEIPGSLELLPGENLEETDELLKLPMEKWKVAVATGLSLREVSESGEVTMGIGMPLADY